MVLQDKNLPASYREVTILYKGYRIRIYPNKRQTELIWKHIGACRFIWNYMLELETNTYQIQHKHLRRFDMMNKITDLRRNQDTAWLRDVSHTSLQRVCTDLSHSYDMFFKKKCGYPKFKSKKRSKPIYPVRNDYFKFKNGKVSIEKVGWVKYKSDFVFPEGSGNKFIDVRISYDNGKYMLSFSMEHENQVRILNDGVMGIDVGIKEFAVAAFCNQKYEFHNINYSEKIKQLHRRLKHIQRSIDRKYEYNKQSNVYRKTKNIIREEEKARRIYRKIANIRNDYLHKTSSMLVSLLPSGVVMEDLNVIGMMKNRYIAGSIQNQCFSEFVRQMQYKCEWNGIDFSLADRFYPSSKTCSGCGNIKEKLLLSERTYICKECGLVIDRDYNAAINLSMYKN